MNIDYRYAEKSAVATSADATTVGFASNLAREATYFRGIVERPLVLREGLATLSDVVRSDFTYRARDRAAFEAYLARRESAFLAALGARSTEAMEALTRLEARLVELDAARTLRRAAFERARRAYIAYAVKSAIELELLLDPVVSVHPDRLCFEAFSRDSSAYAILSLGYAAFSRVDAFACGTTNVDFSAAMRLHVERLRGYRPTSLVVGPSGVRSTSKELTGGLAVLDERRIALPDGWFNGFSNVHGFLSMGLVGVRIDKVDLHDLIRLLAAKKARTSPRALRFELVPGERVRIVVEPFETVLTCAFPFEGEKPATIRVWGRDRLRTIARALPLARSVEVMLLGTGLPYVVRLDLDGEANLTLALSGWTDNDFVEGEARFDLLTRRAHVDASTLTRVHDALRETRVGTDVALSQTLGLPLEKVRSSLSILCQAGRAMIDAGEGRHRYRDLHVGAFDAEDALREANELEASGTKAATVGTSIHAVAQIRIIAHRPVSNGYKVSGNAWSDEGVRVRPQMHIDREGAILDASCTCKHGKKHGLTHGPCAHVLALRLAHMERMKHTHDA